MTDHPMQRGQGELLLIRHGESRDSRVRYWGRTDTELTAYGCEQAAQVGHFLSHALPSTVFVSPLSRAQDTLQPFRLAYPDIEVSIVDELAEIDFGCWEGLTFEEIQTLYPEQVKAWGSSGLAFGFPGGERLSDFWARSVRVAERIKPTAGERVAVVTHGGVIRSMLCHYLGIPPERSRMFQIDCGSWTTLSFLDGFAVLKGLNCHE